jgi:hypothetical protein
MRLVLVAALKCQTLRPIQRHAKGLLNKSSCRGQTSCDFFDSILVTISNRIWKN